MAPYICIQTRLVVDFKSLSGISREFDGILEMVKNCGLEILLSATCRISYSRANKFTMESFVRIGMNSSQALMER
ncbi:hypothetical protein Droror1_Dr00015238, partial [Drosera rotundifolia]